MIPLAFNEGQKRRKKQNKTNKKKTKKKKTLIKEKESSPKSSIYEIISLWIKLITILELPYLHSRSSF